MPIDARPSSLLSYLQDQKFTGSGDANSAGGLLSTFLQGYTSGKTTARENQSVRDKNSVIDANNTALSNLGQAGIIPAGGAAGAQTSRLPERGGLESFAAAFLGNKNRMEELKLKAAKSSLFAQDLQNEEASRYLDDAPRLAEKLTALDRGEDADATGLMTPKSIQAFETRKVQSTAQRKVTEANLGFGNLVNSISDWSSPMTMNTLLNYGASHPEVMKGEVYKNALTNAAAAAKAKEAANLVDKRADNAVSLETLRQDNRVELHQLDQAGKEALLNKRITTATDEATKFLNKANLLKYAAELQAVKADDTLKTVEAKFNEIARVSKKYGLGSVSAPSAPSAPPAAKRIQVTSPDGKLYTIPESQKDEALKQGYKLTQ